MKIVPMEKYEGQIVGIDGTEWLHSACTSRGCAKALANNLETDMYVRGGHTPLVEAKTLPHLTPISLTS